MTNKYQLLLLLTSIGLHTNGQRNLSGKSGLIYIPSAEESQDGEWNLGYNYNPKAYSLRANKKWAEQILYTNINLLPRIQVSFLLLQQRDNGKRKQRNGIGDRQLDIRYQILKEGKNKPSLAIILSSPFTIDAALQTHVLVATKTLTNKQFSICPTFGIGSPYYIYRTEKNLNNGNIFSKLTLQKKSEDRFNNKYLVGFFGGFKASYKDKFYLLAEWDGQKINTGLSTKLFNHLEAQVCLLKFDKAYFGVSYTMNLRSQK
jgi:hypothetical protein